MSFKFTKAERLKSRKVIQAMFNRQGDTFSQFPLRVIWMPLAERRSDSPAQFGLSVPRRRFRNAVTRNRIRRQMREAYRLHKARFYEALAGQPHQYALMVLYTGQEPLPYGQIETAMQQLLRRLSKKIRAQQRRTNP